MRERTLTDERPLAATTARRRRPALALALVLAAAASAGCAPPPRAICDRLQELIAAELTAEDVADFDHAQCVADLELRAATSGTIPREHVDCILAATRLQEVDECERVAELRAREAAGAR